MITTVLLRLESNTLIHHWNWLFLSFLNWKVFVQPDKGKITILICNLQPPLYYIEHSIFSCKGVRYLSTQRNWVLATKLNFFIPMIPMSLQPDGVNLWYFKLDYLILTIIVWNIIRFTTLGCQGMYGTR